MSNDRDNDFGMATYSLDYAIQNLSDLSREPDGYRLACDLKDLYRNLDELTAIIKRMEKMGALKPAGQVILFHKIMQDWDFTDQEAATLLGFEAAADIGEIYLGTKSVAHRDANDRLRAVLRIATDLDALFREVAAIGDWLSEPQRDLDGATPRSLLIEGSMENLLRIKYYVAYLSGRIERMEKMQ